MKGPDLRSVAYETVRRGLQRNPRLAYQFLRDSGGVWTQQNHAQVFDDITHMDRLTKSILGLAMIAKETERIWGPGTEPSDPHRFEARMQVARAIDRETGGHSMEVALADPAKWLELEERFSYDNMVDYKGNNDRSPDAP